MKKLILLFLCSVAFAQTPIVHTGEIINGETAVPSPGIPPTKTGYNWIQSPASPSSILGGANTVTLPSGCPPGLLQVLPGTAQPYVFVHIAGTGTAEDAVITATTCTQHGGAAGTITFTDVNPHSAGYTIQSSSQGFQEALDDSGYLPTNYTYPQLGVTTIPPGNYTFTARVTIIQHGQTVNMAGATPLCNMRDSCIFVGDPANPNETFDVTIIKPLGQPGITNGTYPFIEDNGQRTHIVDGQTRSSHTGGTFGSWVQVDNDQSFNLDGLTAPLGGGIRCDSTYCGPWIYAPGPFSVNAANGWLSHLHLGMQCDGNGIFWASGNGLHVSDSIIEGFTQYGIMGGPGLHGGYLGTYVENVYDEAGGCANPLGNIGTVGMFEAGGNLKVRSGNDNSYPLVGLLPTFASSGSTSYFYFAVINDTTTGKVSAPYLFGQASSNGTGSIPLSWPCITNGTDTITYDILRATPTTDYVVPYGTGNYSVVTGVAQGAGPVCTATDTNASLSSYVVALASYSPTFAVKGWTSPNGTDPMTFWPGGTVLTDMALAFIDDYSTNVSSGGYFVSTAATADGNFGTYPTVFALKCEANAFAGSPIYAVCPANGGGEGVEGGALNATILGFGITSPGGSSVENNRKGRVIFEKDPGTDYSGPTHWLTFADSNPAKTAAYGNNRPPNDANDVWVGLDPVGPVGLGSVPLAFGSPVSISEYIGNVGDGSSWLERLTASAKTFNVNTTVNGNFTVTGTCTGCSGGNTSPLFGTCYAVAQGTATMDSDIRACDAALGHQGIIDATGYNANTTWAAATTIGGTNLCERLILDQAFQINITESDGGKALTVNGCSQLLWRGKSEDQSKGFHLASTANVASIVSEGLYSNSAGIIIEGGQYTAASGATVGTAMIYMQNCFQICEISDAEIDTIPSGGIGLLIDNGASGGLGAGPLTIHNVFVDANTVAAAGIKIIANGTSGVLAPVIIEGGGCVHTGSGNPCVDIEGGSNFNAQAVSFFGYQLESSHSGDIGILCNNCLSFAAHGVFASAVVSGAAVIKLTGVINSVFIDSLDNFNHWTYAIDDVAHSYTDAGSQAGMYVVIPSGETNTFDGKVAVKGLASTPVIGANSSGTLVAGTTVHDLHFAYGTPGGSALSTGVLGYQTVPIACTITGWNIEVDAGTATVKTLKVAAGTAIPTLGSNSISTSGVAIASGTVKQSTTLTDFTTTTITANDIVAADLTAVSGAGYINFELITGCTQ
jgi:hypothetical protein